MIKEWFGVLIGKLPKWWQANRARAINLVLMTASSGIDGVYLGKLMESPDGGGILILGLLLNFAADYTNQEIMMWFGRFRQGTKIQKALSWLLLPCAAMAIGYSWLFSWRQLRPLVYAVETQPIAAKVGASALAQVLEVESLAFAYAGFVPLLIAGLSLVDGIRAGKFRNEPVTKPRQQDASKIKPAIVGFQCQHCQAEFATHQALNAHQRVHNGNGRRAKVQEVTN